MQAFCHLTEIAPLAMNQHREYETSAPVIPDRTAANREKKRMHFSNIEYEIDMSIIEYD